MTASENDNRALLNKIQQKNLDLARSSSRVGDTQRSKLVQLQAEKAKVEDEKKKLAQQLTDVSLSMASLQKQKEKLELNLEDLNHEVAREHKSCRNAEKVSSTLTIQLAEAKRNLDSERQLKTQAQANSRKLQAHVDKTNQEIKECHRQLLLLHKVFDPETKESLPSWETVQPRIPKSVNLAQKLDEVNAVLRVSQEKANRAEAQLHELRRRHEDDMSDLDARHTSTKRSWLEENQPQHCQFN